MRRVPLHTLRANHKTADVLEVQAALTRAGFVCSTREADELLTACEESASDLMQAKLTKWTEIGDEAIIGYLRPHIDVIAG